MASAHQVRIFSAPIEHIYKAIIAVEEYPDFIPGVSGITILSQKKNSMQVEYSVNMIKEFTYIIEMKMEKPTKVSWTFVSGDLFKKNEGYWKLKEMGKNKTEVEYGLDVDFKIFAPAMIINKLVSFNLPQMLDAFEKRVAL